MPSEGRIVGEPANVKESVAYQAGGIVSRTLISENSGSVTLFAFDKDQALSEHTAPYDALIINIEGKLNVRISSIDFVLDAGHMIIMPANEPHALKAVTRTKLMLIMIRAR